MPRDLIVFVSPGTRVRYSESKHMKDESVVVMPAEALESETPAWKIPVEIRAALAAEPKQAADEYVDVPALQHRLALAEDVCAMYGWSAASDNTDRGKATYELWKMWASFAQLAAEAEPGHFPSHEHFPHLTDEVIAELAARRDATRAATLARFGMSEPSETELIEPKPGLRLVSDDDELVGEDPSE